MKLGNLLLCAIAFVAVGCWESALNNVRARAAFEFNCPADKLQVERIEGTTNIGVVGCGKRGVYMGTQAGWALNSVSDDATGSLRAK